MSGHAELDTSDLNLRFTPKLLLVQGHREFPFGNSREFGTPRFPVGNSREFHNSCYRLWNIIFFKGNEAVDAHFLARNSVIRYCTCILPILPSFQASSRQPCNKVPRSRPPARALPKVPRTAHVRVDMSQPPRLPVSCAVHAYRAHLDTVTHTGYSFCVTNARRTFA